MPVRHRRADARANVGVSCQFTLLIHQGLTGRRLCWLHLMLANAKTGLPERWGWPPLDVKRDLRFHRYRFYPILEFLE